MTQLTVKNKEEVLAALRSMPDLVTTTLQPPMYAALLDVAKGLATYPDPPRTYTYVRTGTLGRLWAAIAPTVTKTLYGIKGTVGNKTPYAGYVQGGKADKPTQAYHNTHWQTTDAVLAQKEPEIQQRLQKALDAMRVTL